MTLTDASFADEPTGALAAELPGASAVLRRHGIEFCCEGGLSLREAASRLPVDLAGIEAELAVLDPDVGEDTPQETGALIDHIVTRYHDLHRRQFPELIALSGKIEHVHGDHPELPKGLTDMLNRCARTLDNHMQREEETLFPAMRDASASAVAQLLPDLRGEHDDHGACLAHLRRITNDHVPPEDACGSWRALYAGLAAFGDSLMTHVHLENNVLFPRFVPAA